MAKTPTRSSITDSGDALALEERRAPELKGSINLRIEDSARQLIDDAAAILGKTRTEFMVESARKLAIEVFLDQRLFMMDSRRFEAFAGLLDNPPAPGPRLRSLLRRKPVWKG